MQRVLSFPRTLWRNRTKRTDAPRMMTYIVTFTCNARCTMCDSWKKEPEDELSIEEVDRIFRQVGRLDAIRLTGGEPFVRKDLQEIYDLGVERLRPYVMHITTNGFLTDRIVKLCEERDRRAPLFLLVSIDGPEEQHNEVRGHSSAWRKVNETLRALAPHQKSLNMRIGVNQTIVNRKGMKGYRELHAHLKPLGVRHQVVMAYDQSATYSLTKNVNVAPKFVGEFYTHGDFSTEELDAFLSEVEADTAGLPPLERLSKRYYLKGVRERLVGSGDSSTDKLSDSLINPPCVALSSHLRLYPNGDVPTCQFNSATVGNLRDKSFADLWSDPSTERQREWVRACPGCWAECEVLPNAVYSGDLVKPANLFRARS